MGEVAIRAKGLGKQYRIGERQKYKALRDTLTDTLYSPFRMIRGMLTSSKRVARTTNSIWALKDLSFEINQGEVVGVIGRNGAGKSTLLRILSRITEPTEGYVDLHGRVGSLLEVGTGFHPELTGRENVYLNGSIIGMTKREIDHKFDEIVDFAEVEQFLDTPVKYYSTGMHMRLAFAVAAHLEPEILLVDEVLAVGDAAFQKKCLGKMVSVARQGRTVVFVSHNMAAIRKLCRSALYLSNGRLGYQGSVTECASHYLEEATGDCCWITNRMQVHEPTLAIESVMINGSPYDQLDLSEDAPLLEIEFIGTLARCLRMDIEARLFDIYETPLAFFSPGHERGYAEEYPAGRFRLVRQIVLPRMMRGEYVLSLYLTEPGVASWADIRRAVRLSSAGTATATGLVLDYTQGTGWVLLPEARVPAEKEPLSRYVQGDHLA